MKNIKEQEQKEMREEGENEMSIKCKGCSSFMAGKKNSLFGHLCLDKKGEHKCWASGN